MKPCSRNRKPLALLALDELDACRARELRAHLQTCAGCRRYLEEISTVKATLTAAETKPDIEASESFHRRLTSRLRAEPAGSLWETLAAWVGAARLNWRVALPALGATAVLVVMLSSLVRHPVPSAPVPIRVQVAVTPAMQCELSPTIANYQRVANRSLDELDDLLTRQGTKSHTPTPIYKASLLAFAKASE